MSKSPKTPELTQVRLPAQTKYFAVLLAKRSNISLSEFVAECVEAVLDSTVVSVSGRDLSYKRLRKLLWAEHPADRFVQLASQFPGELTVRERLLWLGVIKQSKEFWNVSLIQLTHPNVLIDEVIKIEALRNTWDQFDSMNRDEITALAQKIKRENDAAYEAEMTPELKEFRESVRTQMAGKKKRIDESQLGKGSK